MRSLDKENAEVVAKHLVAAGGFLEVDVERAYEHAKAAMARAGRVGLVREALGIAAYHAEKYDEAVRELRTHRRISGSNDNLALIADAERGRGKPEKALELLEFSKELEIDHDTRTELVIVAAGAKSDLGDNKAARALLEAEDFTQRPSGALVRLMAAYSDVLRLHGENEMADKYEELSRRTAKATGTLYGDEEPDPNIDIEIETIEEIPDEELESDGEESADTLVDTDTEDTDPEDTDSDDSDSEQVDSDDDAHVTFAGSNSGDSDDNAHDDLAGTDFAAAESASVESDDFELIDIEDESADPASLDTDRPAPSKTHVSEKELKKISVSESEIEDELDEILADLEDNTDIEGEPNDGDAEDAGGELYDRLDNELDDRHDS